MGGLTATETDLSSSETDRQPTGDTAPAKPWRKVAARVGFGLAVMVLVGLMTWLFTDTLGSATAPPRVAIDGLGIFAVFFVAALAVERLIEPLTLLDKKKPELEKDAQDKQEKAKNLQASAAETADADKATAAAEAWAIYRAIALWGLASVVGALAAAMLNLHLLKTAGIQTPSLYLEILATGLIIGAGTKPLHELNKLVTAKKA